MPIPFGLDKTDLKTILKSAYNHSKTTPRGGIWEELARLEGSRDYRHDWMEEDGVYELEFDEREEMMENAVSFCRSRKDGHVYVKTFHDYAYEILKEELGREPEDYEIYEIASNMCDVGGCNIPREEMCGDDEYLGDYHDHPNYPFSPSCNDVRSASYDKTKILCTGSGGRFACLFFDEDQVSNIPCRSGDFDSRLCITGKTWREDALGNYVEEEFNVCPDSYLRGHEDEWVQDVRRLVREGKLKGICYTDDKFGERVICDFGDRDIITFDIKELE